MARITDEEMGGALDKVMGKDGKKADKPTGYIGASYEEGGGSETPPTPAADLKKEGIADAASAEKLEMGEAPEFEAADEDDSSWQKPEADDQMGRATGGAMAKDKWSRLSPEEQKRSIIGNGGYIYKPETDGSITIIFDPTGKASGLKLSKGSAYEAIKKELGALMNDPTGEKAGLDMARAAGEQAKKFEAAKGPTTAEIGRLDASIDANEQMIRDEAAKAGATKPPEDTGELAQAIGGKKY